MGQFIGKTIIEGGQGRTIKKYDLNDIVGRPTGQGYGKARTGPQTKGPIEAVSDVEYPQGESFTTNTKNVKNLTEAKDLLKNTKQFKNSFDYVNKRKDSSDPKPRLIVKRVYENNKIIKGKAPRKSIFEKSKGGSLVASLYKGF